MRKINIFYKKKTFYFLNILIKYEENIIHHLPYKFDFMF